ncbi:hypothetical protein CDAR_593571 [Caerostris darwini]|uniref:Uncharacterized protein n=1 Tax=Caerostris darwini TaxID=1538125 RepID=A0AAV4RYV6_9ARAC|nr:hypothetical protein CDAR_593571 [Caerostris darwini]
MLQFSELCVFIEKTWNLCRWIDGTLMIWHKKDKLKSLQLIYLSGLVLCSIPLRIEYLVCVPSLLFKSPSKLFSSTVRGVSWLSANILLIDYRAEASLYLTLYHAGRLRLSITLSFLKVQEGFGGKAGNKVGKQFTKKHKNETLSSSPCLT